jgi:hypothetical protein
MQRVRRTNGTEATKSNTTKDFFDVTQTIGRLLGPLRTRYIAEESAKQIAKRVTSVLTTINLRK